ncbi:MAG: tRNA lysidine(34) synthetase TilS, partial [Acidobacteriota bacterium]
MSTRKPSNKLKRLEAQALHTIRRDAMIDSGNRILVAVSGGPDSMALLLCLHRLAPILHCDLAVAHLNHRIRGKEADGDEAFVRGIAGGLGLPYFSETIDVSERAAASGQNLEQVAREIRYKFLNRTARKAGAGKIAVGHNQNDQMETVLFRFLRGSGIEGLTAIHPVVEGYVIRPLLESTRDSILRYLRQNECGYREDASNSDMRHSRNRIRHELIPYLEKHFNPQLSRTVSREASLMREVWDYIHSQAQQIFKNSFRRVEGGIALAIPAIQAMHPALQREVLRCAIKQCIGHLKGIARDHIEAALSLCLHSQSGGRIHLPHNHAAIRQFDELLLVRQTTESSCIFRYELNVPGYCHVGEAGGGFRAEICGVPQGDKPGKSRNCAFFDASVLSDTLIIRSRAEG